MISEHEQAASILALTYLAFTAALIVTFAARRIAVDGPTGLTPVDRLLSVRGISTALRAIVVALAIGAGFFVYRTGDLGAKAAWARRLERAERRDSRRSGAAPSARPGIVSTTTVNG